MRAQPAATNPPGDGGGSSGGGGGGGGGRPRRPFTPQQREMIEGMRRNGVKFDPDKLVDVRRMPDGRVVFLESGGPKAGLEHILSEHSGDFMRKGVPDEEEVPGLIMDALERGRVIGYRGKGTGRPIYEAIVGNTSLPISITTGSNGFVVGANPTTVR